MARADLYGLSKQISDTIKDLSSKDSFFRKYLDYRDQEYSSSVEEFYSDMSKQYRYVKKYSTLNNFDEELKKLCVEYVATVYQAFADSINSSRVSSTQKITYTFVKGSTPQAFSVIATTIEGRDDGNKFRAINDKKRAAFNKFKKDVANKLFGDYRSSSGFIKYDREVRLRGKIDPKSKYEKLETAIFGSVTFKDKKDKSLGTKSVPIDPNDPKSKAQIAFRAGGSAQAGHRDETSVNALLKETILNSISSDNFDREVKVGSVTKTIPSFEISSSARTYIKNALSGGKSRTLKEITSLIKFYDQSSRLNQAASSKEKSELKKVPELIIDSIISSMGIQGIANQKASLNGFELTELAIVSSIDKAFGKQAKINSKVTGSKSDSTTKAPTLKVSKKVTTTKIKDNHKGSPITISEKETRPSRQEPIQRPTQNWLSLLPMINSRLLPKVLANMKAPALVNRTGTFAQSAKVLNIEQTAEGFPSFVFDYERDPYDVFDRVKGRSPWNTLQRDPRALVDRSVREVVREMAISRFYTRRA